jgi:hypothetical protein
MVGLVGGTGWLDDWVYPWGDGSDRIGSEWKGKERYGMNLLLCVLIFDISVVITLNSMFVFFRRHPSGHLIFTV